MIQLCAVVSPSRWGLRIRSAVVSAVVVAVVLAAAAAAILWFLHRSSIRELDSTAEARAADIAAELTRTSPSGVPDTLLNADGNIAVVQVLAADGNVARSSSPRFTTPVLVTDTDATGLRGRGDYDDWRITTRSVATREGLLTVLVVVDSESAEQAVTKVTALLGLVGPAVVLASAAATYLLVGRSLRSVEAIRSRVARIGGADLSERVPVPAARDEIAWLAETMNGMLARVEATHAAQRRFVGDASHELRSPLATLTAALELARDQPTSFDRDMITATMLPETHRMRSLIEDLLTLAAADENGLELHVEEVDLDDVARVEAATLRLRGLTPITTETTPVRVIGDSKRLTRMMRNLLDNAAAHARARVAVATAAIGDRARIVVEDDGPGVPIPDRQRIFERFVRLDPGRARTTGGSGLGLAIVAEIVTAHGGSVTVTESRWGGACFVVDLPVAGPVGVIRVDQPVSDAP
ncbi:sensor histidine kinase [Nocardia exalbida]|uniref:sensor histidine kinase n=1 Tax=Nocardia exalbida TaxID=290231 RepID=UPI0002EA2A60|nr:HAMP domain-containing sensor histidine kinase [Nocardia exalbida]